MEKMAGLIKILLGVGLIISLVFNAFLYVDNTGQSSEIESYQREIGIVMEEQQMLLSLLPGMKPSITKNELYRLIKSSIQMSVSIC